MNEDEGIQAQFEARSNTTNAILKFMSDKGIKKADLARNLDVSRSTVTKWLNGERNLELMTLGRIAHGLGAKLKISFE